LRSIRRSSAIRKSSPESAASWGETAHPKVASTWPTPSGISALELQLAALERRELLRPWRRARRWLLHPLTIAVVESWARRRKRAQEARLESMGLR